jgi:RNA polymerase sigma factor (sigma-70 family)
MTFADDDTHLMAQAVNDPEAFAEIYRRHQAPIVRYLRRRLGDAPAEDAATRVFMYAFTRRDAYVPVHPTALPWLYGIAAHVIADHHRSEGRRLRALERLASRREADQDETGEPGLPPVLVRALRKLPLADRETFLLVVLGELSYEETATALDVPVGTVRSRVARARSRLQHQLPQRPVVPLPAPGELHA